MTYFFTPPSVGVHTIFGWAAGKIGVQSEVIQSVTRSGHGGSLLTLTPVVVALSIREGAANGKIGLREYLNSGLEFLPTADGFASGLVAVGGAGGGSTPIRSGMASGSISIRSSVKIDKINERGYHPGPLASLPLGAWDPPVADGAVSGKVGVKISITSAVGFAPFNITRTGTDISFDSHVLITRIGTDISFNHHVMITHTGTDISFNRHVVITHDDTDISWY